MDIKPLDYRFSVCKVTDYTLLDPEDLYCFTGKTDEEASLVCRTEKVPSNVLAQEDGWKAFRIQGILDFSLIGIMARISSLLAEHGISVFVVSTYHTDYFFVKEVHFSAALQLLAADGNTIL